MRNVRFQISYDGSLFFGWQRQDGFETVQQSIEEAFQALVAQSVVVHGAGRTDTGVHARGQVAHAHVDTRLDDDRLRHALNAHLVPGVVVTHLETCSDEFHARFDARGKRYLYVTVTTRFRPPYLRDYCHWTNKPLDREAMGEAARRMQGRHDFRAFASAGSERKDTVRTVRAVRLVARRERFAIVVEGDGFLYNMVRTMAGTLLAVGAGRMKPEQIDGILASRDRCAAGPTAPAAGLHLLRVFYGEPVFRGPQGGAARPEPGLFGGAS